MEQIGSHWTDFDKILYFSILRKYVEKAQVTLKSYKNNGYFMKTYVHLWQYVAELFLEWEMFQVRVVEKTKTFYVQ